MTKHEEILLECKKERDNVRKMIKEANKKAGWFMGSALMKQEIKNAQKKLASMYIDLISDNITELNEEMDEYDFRRIFDLYSAYEDGEEISLDDLPEEVLI